MPAPTGLVLVRNDVVADSRINREVDALRAAGLRPLVAGVATARAPAARGELDGAPLVRLGRAPAAAPGGGGPGPSPARIGPAARLRRIAGGLRYHLRALRLVARERPALLHCNDHNTMWTGVAARLRWRIPVVYDAHELWPDRNGRWELRPWLLATEWLFVRVAGAVTVTSPGHAAVMARRYRIPAPVVVRNVPRAAEPLPAQQEERPFTLGYAGGLLPGRGLEDAIAALAELPEARLVTIGPGREAERARLLGLAERHGVAGRVELRDPVAPHEVAGALAAAADLGLVLFAPEPLSYGLGLPTKLWETVGAGLPVIATDLPVLGATVRELGVGEVVPPGDPAAVASAARRLADPAARAALEPAIAAARGRFTWERERPALAGIYSRLAPPDQALDSPPCVRASDLPPS